MATEEDLGQAVGDLAEGGADRAAFARTVRLVGASVKAAGAKSVASGRWLAETLLDTVPHIPVRDAATLSEAHGGRTGRALAEELVRSASHRTAAFGAVAGALAGAHSVAPPTWVALPAELVAETLVVVVVELKLVAELHQVYGKPVPGSTAILAAWAEGRGVAEVLSKTPRRELTKMIQRRLARRAIRNTAAWIPLMAGAVAGAELNRRATQALGDKMVAALSP